MYRIKSNLATTPPYSNWFLIFVLKYHFLNKNNNLMIRMYIMSYLHFL